MPATLEEKATQCLGAANLTLPQLATQMGLSEPELTTLYRLGDLRLSEPQSLAKCLRVPPTYLLNGSFLQASNCNTQKIRRLVRRPRMSWPSSSACAAGPWSKASSS